MLLVIAVFSLPALAKFDTCGIPVGTKEIVYEAIKKALKKDRTRIYAMKCRGAAVGQQVCTAYQYMSSDMKDAVSAAEDLLADKVVESELTFYAKSNKHRLDAFIPFIDKQVLSGKLCYGEVFLRVGLFRRNKVYGPGDTFRKEIANGRANFVSAAVPETFRSLKPDDVIKQVFHDLSNKLQPQRLNIVIFPEFFFNRIYRTGNQRVLNNKMVGSILKEYRTAFGGKWNVLCSLSLFHMFPSTETPPWLQNWEKPAWLGNQKAWWTFSGWEEDQADAFKAVFGSPERRLANYQLFLCNGMELAVYRKGCYVNEMELGVKLAGQKVVMQGSESTYEFGNWKTTIVANHELSHEIATMLFGANGVIIPRICGDLHYLAACNDAQGEFGLYYDKMNPKQGSLLLVTGAGIPTPKGLKEFIQKTKITVIEVDCGWKDHLIVVGNGEEVKEIHEASLVVGSNQDGNMALMLESKRNRCKDLKAALCHLTRFISRRCRANCQDVSQLDALVGELSCSKRNHKRNRCNDLKAALCHLTRFIARRCRASCQDASQFDDLVGGFSRSKRNHKRNKPKDLKAALCHLTRLIHGHHTRQTVNCCNSAMQLRCGKKKHDHP